MMEYITFKLFTNIAREDITHLYEIFNTLTNELKVYGKTYTNKKLCSTFIHAFQESGILKQLRL